MKIVIYMMMMMMMIIIIVIIIIIIIIGQDMNGTHQVLAYADDVNLIADDIRKIERNADVFKCL